MEYSRVLQLFSRNLTNIFTKVCRLWYTFRRQIRYWSILKDAEVFQLANNVIHGFFSWYLRSSRFSSVNWFKKIRNTGKGYAITITVQNKLRAKIFISKYLVKYYLMEDTNLLLLWECWLEGPGLLKPSYSSSLTGEISRPSYWWLLDDVSADAFASVAGWVLIGMLTPVIPPRGLCACLIWPREYIPCVKWVPLGVDNRRCGVSFLNECVAIDVFGLDDSVTFLALSLKDCLESSVAALDARDWRNETCFALFLPPFCWTGVSLLVKTSIGGRTKFLPM